jgi:hypothetical protein
VTEREMAKQAADWINRTSLNVYPMVRCHPNELVDRWYVSRYASKSVVRGGYDTDAELIDRAREMGWTPEETQ